MATKSEKVKFRVSVCVGTLVLASVLRGLAQGTFQNLDFESASLSPIPPGQFGGGVSISIALPNWTGYLGDVQTLEVLQNNLTLGNASIDILGPYWVGGPVIIEGNYTAVLQAGLGSVGVAPATIAQTGVVPLTARSLQLKAQLFGPFSQFEVALGGQAVAMVPLGGGVYGGDISAFAGQTLELKIAAVPTETYPNSGCTVDAIVFSDQPIPEPSAIGFFALGSLLLGRRFARERQFSSKR